MRVQLGPAALCPEENELRARLGSCTGSCTFRRAAHLCWAWEQLPARPGRARPVPPAAVLRGQAAWRLSGLLPTPTCT